MQRIPSGRIIRPFLYPVSGRIPDFTAGYPVRPDTGKPAGYPANIDLILLIFKKFFTEIILVTRKFFALRFERIVILKLVHKFI
jgi:hypothetical protein